MIFFADASDRAVNDQYALAKDLAQFADQHGFEAVWLPERHFHSFGGAYPNPAVMASVLAQLTSRVRIRAGSVVLPLHHPLEVVEQWGMIDNMSGGRVDLGFASGWNPNDFALSPTTFNNRRDIWFDRIDEVKRLWKGESLEYLNGLQEKVRLQPRPQPVQSELQPWLTVTREDASFVEAGKRGLNVLTMLMGISLDQLAAKIKLYRDARKAAGHDPATGRITLATHTFVHESMDTVIRIAREPLASYIEKSFDGHRSAMRDEKLEATRNMRDIALYATERYFKEGGIFGGIDDAYEAVERARNAGVDEIACVMDFGPSRAQILESLPWLARLSKRVMPGFDVARNTMSTQQYSPTAMDNRPEDNLIAVVGMSGRFPGAENVDALWEVLLKGESQFRDPPEGRWPAGVPARRCGFIDDIELFDPLFFSISPREARGMDPHQRLFLTESWRALEHAGIAPSSLRGSRTGVFAAMYNTDFVTAWALAGGCLDPEDATGSAHSLVANRVSYALGLTGPSEITDTACSSSLVAVHRAIQALRAGECDLALAGGVSLILSPGRLAALANLGILSVNGVCRAFDKDPSGQVMGEGVGVIVLKRYQDAIKDKDPILALVRGSAVNHQGAQSGNLTLPAVDALCRLQRDACRDAGIDAGSVAYIEAHAAGGVGDLIELEAAKTVFQNSSGQVCRIGSMKPVIGFLEAAGGIAQIIKVIQMLRHRLVPGTISGQLPDNIDSNARVRVVRSVENWLPDANNHLYAGIQAYGLGGTSAHLVFDQAPCSNVNELTDSSQVAHAIVLSARTERSLRAQASALADYLAIHADISLADVATTLQVGRDILKSRLVLIAHSLPEAIEKLKSFAHGAVDICWGPERSETGVPEMLKVAMLSFMRGERTEWPLDAKFNAQGRRINLPGQVFDARALPLLPAQASVIQVSTLEVSASRTAVYPAAVDQSQSDGDDSDLRSRSVERVLTELLCQSLELLNQDIERDQTFSDLGLGSLQGLRFLQAINERFAISLEMTELYRSATLATLATVVSPLIDETFSLTDGADALGRSDQNVDDSPFRADAYSSEDDAIAVIGMAGQFPGAPDIDVFWQNIRSGQDSVTQVPAERWDASEFFDPVAGKDGKTYCKWGGFITDPFAFDPLFFNLSPAEAEVMDPQQRKLLEVCWKALEDAALAPSSLSGKRCGIYVGQQGNEYLELINSPALASRTGPVMVGNSISMLPARLAYLLNLQGPTLAVDTACSSSLCAVHLAARALADGDADLMIASGVNLYLSERPYLMMSRAGMLSATGRCQAFSADADGMVPGEAVAAVVLKRLSDAIADGDVIHGVILASGMNQDGKSNGITAPNGNAQRDLELSVYARGEILPETITMIEAHGTGTPLGDPVELKALEESFRQGTNRTGYCAIGSVKSNIGHASAAAGIVGLVKILLALKHKEIPPTLHAHRPSRHFDFKRSPFVINSDLRAWSVVSPRRAALSSFGFSGTNVHMVIQQAPERVQNDASAGPWLIPLSARSKDALLLMASELLARLSPNARPHPRLCDVAFTLQIGRDALEHRQIFLATSIVDLSEQLNHFVQGRLLSLPEGSSGELARSFMKGINVSWPTDRTANRISLSGHPFIRAQYRIKRQTESSSVHSVKLHPLVDQNCSDIKAIRFTTRLNGTEFYLADHIIGGQRVLPGMASIEMARAAGSLALGEHVTVVTNMAWLRPIIQNQEPVELTIRFDQRSAAGMHFVIESLAGIHSEGSLQATRLEFSESNVDVRAIRSRCSVQHAGSDIYRFLAQSGLAYGPAFRVIQNAYGSKDEVLAELNLPLSAGDVTAFVLHPSILDASTQAIVAMEHKGLLKSTRVPFAIERLEVFASLQEKIWVHVRRAAISGDVEKFDIDLLDPSGRILVKMHGYSAKSFIAQDILPLAQASIRPPSNRPVLLVPVQEDIIFELSDDDIADPKRGAVPQQILVLGEGSWREVISREFAHAVFIETAALSSALINAPQSAVLIIADLTPNTVAEVLSAVQALASDVSKRFVMFAHPAGDDYDIAEISALAALWRTFSLENPGKSIKSVGFTDWSNRQGVVRGLVHEWSTHPTGMQESIWQGGRRSCVSLIQQHWPSGYVDRFKTKGVYVLTGGSGAIARKMSQELAAKYQARLVLFSRSAIDSAWIRTLELCGAEVLALQVDVSDAQSVQNGIQTALLRFGQIDGVLHMAGVLRDGLIASQTHAMLSVVTGPKIQGAVNLERALNGLPLDFFVLFSSAATLGNLGQGLYAYASRYLDYFAQTREVKRKAGQCSGKTISIDWSLWREGGMRASPEATEALWNQFGILPIETDSALEVLKYVVSTSFEHSRVLPLSGNEQQILASFTQVSLPHSISSTMSQTPAAAALPQGVALEYLTSILANELKLSADQINPDDRFERYGVDSIMAMQLTRLLELDLGELPKTLFFECRTVGELAQRLQTDYANAFSKNVSAQAQSEQPPQPQSQTQDQPAAVHRNDQGDAIAIIGVSGRFPKAESLSEFWENLISGRDCIEEIPDDRFAWRHLYDSDHTRYGSLYAKWGGFISDVDKFDPLFFRISPREASFMDPQERIFLQTAWSCVESAGYAPSSLAGRNVGVYAGTMYGEYQLLGVEETERGNVLATASFYASVANRVSYALDLIGPSMALDTMCSSSLTAIHLAVQAIRSGDCEMAIAGGVNVSIHPNKFLTLSQGRFASTDGRCRSFGSGGTGYVPGEGVGAVLLKPLEKAIADGDNIWGVIRGSALSHGGRTSGYTVPNPVSQGLAISAAMARAGIQPRDISYVEAHGTGTSLGDPVEVNGLSRAFGHSQPGDATRTIGSVKSNIGHLEGAAGIAGVIKVLLQMQHGEIAPTLHTEPLNPNIDFTSMPFNVSTDRKPWQRRQNPDGSESPRIAGVSAFGAGGANAHVIIEEYQQVSALRNLPVGPAILVVSAKDEDRLLQSVSDLYHWMSSALQDAWTLHDVAYTLQVGRDAYASRWSVVAHDITEAIALMRAFLMQPVVSQTDDMLKNASVLQRELAHALQHKDAQLIASVWRRGGQIDWQSWHHDVSIFKRLVLPTYPFARERCWIERTPSKNTLQITQDLDAAPVLMQNNLARVDLALSPNDPLINSHQVAGKRVIPGTLSIVLALAAARKQWPQRKVVLHDLVWQTAVVVADQEATASLTLKQDSYLSTFTLESASGPHAQGVIVFDDGGFKDVLPADPLSGGETFDGYDFYTQLAEGGIRYGSHHRGLRNLRVCNEHAEVELVLDTTESFLSHAAWLDACLHGIAGLAAESSGLSVPFSVKEVRIEYPLPRRATVRLIRREVDLFDLAARDEKGRLVVGMLGLRLRPLGQSPSPSKIDTPSDLLADMIWLPRWRAQSVDHRRDIKGPVVVLYPSGDSYATDLANEIARRYELSSIATLGESFVEAGLVYVIVPAHAFNVWDGSPQQPGISIVDFIHCIKPLFQRRLPLVFITRQALAVSANDLIDPVGAGVFGLIRSAAREHATDVSIVDIDLHASLLDTVSTLMNEPVHQNAESVAIRKGARYLRWLDKALLPDLDGTPWKKNGHYLIVGGAGGIGFILSQHLARTQGANITWIGRRSIDARIQDQLADIRRLGGDAAYFSSDACNPVELAEAISQSVQRFGEVNGVFHAALVLRDGLFLNASDEDFLAAFEAKARSVMVLAQVMQRHPLDFFTVFSSAISFTANPGQANYCAGSSFIDAFVHELSRVGVWPAYVINWGFWGSVGAVAHPEAVTRMAAQGVLSIDPAEGIQVIERTITAGISQVVPLKLSSELSEKLRHNLDVVLTRLTSNTQAVELAGLSISVQAPDIKALQTAQLSFSRLDAYGRSRAAMSLASVLPSPGQQLTVTHLVEKLGVTPARMRLFNALLAMFERDGWLKRIGENIIGVAFPHPVTLDDTQAIEAFQPLLDACLDGLNDVIVAKKTGAQVVFPAGSQSLVEKVYRGDAMMDFYSRTLAEVVSAWFLQSARSELKIIEIGAGTGAATRFVLESVESLTDKLDYCFTDISLGFIERARLEMGPVHPCLRFELLDIANHPQTQGFNTGYADVVIASNVLHATTDINTTIAHAKTLLRPGGLLVVNEVTSVQDYATLTFGLLDGWWSYSDSDSRLAHSPLLSVPLWLDRLKTAGFSEVKGFGLPGLSDDDMPQGIVAAISDGWVEQHINHAPLQTKEREANAVTLSHAKPRMQVIIDGVASFEDGIEYARQVLGKALGMKPAAIASQTQFASYGFDSLTMMEVVKRLETDLCGAVPPTLLLDCTTLDELGQWLSDNRNSELFALTGKAVRLIPTDSVVPVVPVFSELSLQQLWHWSVATLMPEATGLLAVPAAFRFAQNIDRKRLQSALNLVVSRHQTLRTVFVSTPQGPRQTVRPSMDVTIGSHVDASDFNLAEGPLLRLALIAEEGNTFRFEMLFHHLIADIWSIGVFLSELSLAYEEQTLPVLKRTYADYVETQRLLFTPALIAERKAFWVEQLQDAARYLELGKGTSSSIAQGESSQVSRTISPELVHRLRQGAEQMQRTPFTVLFAAFTLMLYAQTSESKFPIGVPTSNRAGTGDEALIGDFADIMLVVPQLDVYTSTVAFVSATGEALDQATRHVLPFSETSALIRGLSDDPTVTPLQACCTYARQLGQGFSLSGLTGTPVETNRGALVFSLFLTMIDRGDSVTINLEYLDSLMNESSAHEWLIQYEAVLDAMLSDPGRPIYEVLRSSGVSIRPQLRFVSSFTSEPAEPYVNLLAKEFDLAFRIGFAPFGQIMQELLNVKSESYRLHSGAVAVLWRLSDLLSGDATDLAALDSAALSRTEER
ncbi:MAG: MupA/Atu3671 family FMN-dependent luciferase-like monooxygenase, partial [Alcaligenaceae bacterium]